VRDALSRLRGVDLPQPLKPQLPYRAKVADPLRPPSGSVLGLKCFNKLSEGLEIALNGQGGRAGDGRSLPTDVLVTVKQEAQRATSTPSVPSNR